METGKLRKFASFARSALIEQVGTRLKTVLAEKSLARRESPKVVEELEKKIRELGEKPVVEMVAYTWFNRFCALRYMDVNRYTRIGVLSPAAGQFQPEILAEAKMGHIDEELMPEATRKQVMRLLDGSDKSADPQGEAYRLLLVAVCNYYQSLMPFMFEKIADYTELLLPDDLLSGTSIPAYTREALLPINCSPEHTEESVEVIGWLYQFYIADKKDEVFAELKKGKKIPPEDIPSATQLFTPHWIVRYLVENSLGRLWMLNHPESKLVERMDYYIKPEEPETGYLKIASPDEIKVCDPACGSGHMLTYAFDILYEIYREEQYPEPEIPSLILKNNLYGIEIDPRAGALAAFALTMKAREKDKRFFTRKPQPDASSSDSVSMEHPKSKIQNPNVCVLENIKIEPDDLSAYMDKVGRNLFTGSLQTLLTQWEEADNLGSLIRPMATDVSDAFDLLRERQMGQDLFLANVHNQVLKALRQADCLSPKYHVVVANPPYMGSKGMNLGLKDYLGNNYESFKGDLFCAFIVRCLDLTPQGGNVSLVTPFTWMFLSSYKELREFLLRKTTIQSMIRPEYHAFFDSAYVPLCAFSIHKVYGPNKVGTFIDLSEFYGADLQAPKSREAIADPTCAWRFACSGTDLQSVPGSPIAFWLTNAARKAFRSGTPVKDLATTRVGMATGDNDRFVRFWFEVGHKRIGFGLSREEARNSKLRWFPYSNGGEARKWYANYLHVVNWAEDGHLLQTEKHESGRIRAHNFNLDRIFQPGLTWSLINASYNAIRVLPKGFLFSSGAPSLFCDNPNDAPVINGLYNSSVAQYFLSAINPTLNNNSGDTDKLPLCLNETDRDQVRELVGEAIELAKEDWDSSEVSWEFAKPSLISNKGKLQYAYLAVREILRDRVQRMHEVETKNNKLIATAYGLNGEVQTTLPPESITLDSNPLYRYGADKDELELESLLLADMMREYISYAVGCMFGRYSLDKPGLILANQGETVADFRRQVPEPKFVPDEDNVIPILDGEWFSDDISQRFKDFLKVTFGIAQYDENLEFLENALYPDNSTAKKRKTIRDYFLKDFYDHHLKMYKKRPIYWLFSSPKGTFNALIYMHRYRPETVGKVLECLRDFRDKLAHHAEHRQMTADSASASKMEKTQAVKEVAAIKKQLKELEEFEKTLFEVAAKKIPIDLDDGVKHNYPLFGSVLRKIPGLDAKDD